jgi:hypothetical protein
MRVLDLGIDTDMSINIKSLLFKDNIHYQRFVKTYKYYNKLQHSDYPDRYPPSNLSQAHRLIYCILTGQNPLDVFNITSRPVKLKNGYDKYVGLVNAYFELYRILQNSVSVRTGFSRINEGDITEWNSTIRFLVNDINIINNFICPIFSEIISLDMLCKLYEVLKKDPRYVKLQKDHFLRITYQIKEVPYK